MAFQEYDENQSIHSMTTRQLRKYISEAGAEAQKRLDTAPKDASRAFTELAGSITNKAGKVLKGSSTLSKAEMRERAYALRQFNKFDAESGYEARTDYQKNKQRYETFIRNQISKSGTENQYWSKFITEKGNVSKKGYQEYKDYIATLKASEEYLKSFGYRTIQQYAQNNNNNIDPGNKILNKTLSQVYLEYKGKGLTQAELIDKFKERYDEALNKASAKKKNTSKTLKVKHGSNKSKTNIKVKKTGKMRTSGKVREKLT